MEINVLTYFKLIRKSLLWSIPSGIMMVMMLPSPMWFTLVDLGLAYIPMAYLAGKLAVEKK